MRIIDSTIIHTSEEFKQALTFLYAYEMTMFRSIDEYDPYRKISRQEAAKMLSQFAMNVLCRKPQTTLSTNYTDMEGVDLTLRSYIDLAYKLGLMK